MDSKHSLFVNETKSFFRIVIRMIVVGNLDSGYGVMPDELGNLKQLTTLSIQNTRIIKMADQLGNLTTLTSLTLINCGLLSLPNLSKLTSLSNLIIDSNPITSLIGVQKVAKLTLRNCQFSSIPTMTIPTALINLDMSNNQLSEVRNLSLYRSLRTVDFNRNRINVLLSSIVHLRFLNTIIMSNNELYYLPDEILQLNSLITLNIANNTFSPTELQLVKDKFKARRPAVKLIT